MCDGSESLAVTITGVPGGASLSAGTDLGGGAWSLTLAQLTGLTITPPPGSEADFILGVTATSTEAANGDQASTTGTINVTVVDKPADAPTLSTTAATGNEDTAIPLAIASALTDSGEVLSLEISGVPVGAGASLSAGTDQGGGVWLLTPAQLTGLTITPPTNSDVDFSLTVTATSTEPLNGSTATTTATLDVTVIAVADAPTLSATAAGDEDTPIPLTISAALTDTDGSESLSAVRIFGVPTGATLSAGTFVPSMTGTSVSGGTEIQVNTFTANAQRFSSIAPLNDGGFISTWESVLQDTSGFGVYSQRWDAAGQAVGGEFRVNTTTFNNQGGPSVAAALGDGGWVVVWTSQGQDGSGTGIFGQRYDAGGNTAGGEFQVNDFTTNNQGAPDVQGLVGGGFVVTWDSEGQDVSGQGMFAKQYDTSGVEVATVGSGAGPATGNEFLVNSAESFTQRFGSVGALQDGGYVVVWESDATAPDSSGFGVFGQRYDQTGNTVGGQFLANTTTFSSQNNGVVTGLGDGGFVIAWQSFSQDGDGWGVFAQRYDVNGVQVGGELQVNTTTASSQQRRHRRRVPDQRHHRQRPDLRRRDGAYRRRLHGHMGFARPGRQLDRRLRQAVQHRPGHRQLVLGGDPDRARGPDLDAAHGQRPRLHPDPRSRFGGGVQRRHGDHDGRPRRDHRCRGRRADPRPGECDGRRGYGHPALDLPGARGYGRLGGVGRHHHLRRAADRLPLGRHQPGRRRLGAHQRPARGPHHHPAHRQRCRHHAPGLGHLDRARERRQRHHHRHHRRDRRGRRRRPRT